MADAYTLTNARTRLGELVNRARFGRERVILSEHGRPVAAIISVEELAEMQAAIDAADIEIAATILASDEPRYSHEQVMAAMDAWDAADQATTPEEAAAIMGPYAHIFSDTRTGPGAKTDEPR